MDEKKDMSKKEIFNRMKALKSDGRKHYYLKQLEKKIGITKPKTRKAFYSTLGDITLRLGYIEDASDCYKLVGDKYGLRKVKEALEREHRGLTTKLLTIAIVGFAGSIFFLSNNITGNVIGAITKNNSNFIGGILFVLGLVGLGFFLKKR